MFPPCLVPKIFIFAVKIAIIYLKKNHHQKVVIKTSLLILCFVYHYIQIMKLNLYSALAT